MISRNSAQSILQSSAPHCVLLLVLFAPAHSLLLLVCLPVCVPAWVVWHCHLCIYSRLCLPRALLKCLTVISFTYAPITCRTHVFAFALTFAFAYAFAHACPPSPCTPYSLLRRGAAGKGGRRHACLRIMPGIFAWGFGLAPSLPLLHPP